MPRPRVMVVDDEVFMRESLEETLSRAGFDVQTHAEASGALEAFRRSPPDLVITDLNMPGMRGDELIPALRAVADDVPIILITAYATLDNAVAVMKRGAFDYIQKPFTADAIEVAAAKALEVRRLKMENQALKDDQKAALSHDFVPGESAAMKALFAQVRKVAESGATVLISGESGTGKEVVARAIHLGGPRARAPFYAVNCAALSAGLLESELFGHEKGAFTGADRQRRGRFELADGGAILLDEVSEIDPGLQAKLLRVLQEREFERVGSSERIQVDVRVIATTNRDLPREVQKGRFREDLYFRLNVIPIHVPPLRERPDDIPALARHFAAKFARRDGRAVPDIPPETMALFSRYHWPGNVRELANVIERATTLAPGQPLRDGDIAPWLTETATTRGEALVAGMSIDDMEHRLTEVTLRAFAGDRNRTADALGITTKTLRAKMRKWGLLPPAEEGAEQE
ncbi:MAG: sigma-54-dependent Fis family transcriptional regulator [Planctomycetes bacterium]|nr:sigma-54-dependent Fis family transcriptional regulator [Planctomycetota bacterium]